MNMTFKQTKQEEKRWLDFCDDFNNYYGGEFSDYLLTNLGINKLKGKEHDRAITTLHNFHKVWRQEVDYHITKKGNVKITEE